MKTERIFFTALLLLLLFAGCAAGANDLAGSADAEGIVAGFWRGLWHGLIVPITFLISLFTPDVQMYEVHNNGNWYNFGFFCGIACALGGSHGAGRSKKKA